MARSITLERHSYVPPGAAEEAVFDHRLVLLDILRAGDAKGLSIDDMRTLMPILDKLEAAGGPGRVILEESEWTLVRARLADNRWRFADKVIVDFVDAIEGAPAIAP